MIRVTDYPPGWEADVVLADGSTAHIRPIVPEDADRIVALHGRLSDRTRYLRYFGPYPRIPDRDLEHFTRVDYVNRVALVAGLGDELIAVCRYDRINDSQDAEVAFVVEDAHQGHGLGSVMLEHLAAAARERGISRFVAEVLAENARMARVFLDAGYQAERSFQDGVVHLSFPIEPTARSTAVAYEREQRAEARSIERLLTPRSLAVIGASADPAKLGHVLLSNVLANGFTGATYAVNPRGDPILGVPTYRSVSDIAEQVDVAVIAAPAAAVPEVAEECARKKVRALVVVSGGFAERNEAGRQAEAALVGRARQGGMRVLGPNCLGIINTSPDLRLNATLAPVTVPHGRVGFFCQSGALGSVTLQAALARGIGLSTFVSAGNRADVSGNDLLQFWAADPGTDVVLLWLESFGNPRKFTRLVRRTARQKPVVLLGRGPWTDAEDDGRRRLLADIGLIAVNTVEDLFDVAMVLGYQPLPAGRSAAVVGNSAALGVLAADACTAAGLAVAQGYPFDSGPDATPAQLADAVKAALATRSVDAILVVFVPALPSAGTDHAQALAAALDGSDKPVVSMFLGVEGFPEGLAQRTPDGVLARGSVPSYPSPERAVNALARAVRYAHWRGRPVGHVPELDGIDRASANRLMSNVLARAAKAPEIRDDGLEQASTRRDQHNATVPARRDEQKSAPSATRDDQHATAPIRLHDRQAAALLNCYGISVWPRRLVRGAREALDAASQLGYPVALKSAEGPLAHRTDLGGVVLDLTGPEQLQAAYDQYEAGETLAVQSMAPVGIPTTVAMSDDPAFGALISFGIGGITSELLGDRAYASAPMTDLDAARLVRAPRAAPLLSGYRGAAPVDLGALEQLLLRVSRLAEDLPEVLDVRLDPVLVSRDRLTVLGAEVSVEHATARADPGPRRMRPVS